MTVAAWMLFAMLVAVGMTLAAAALDRGCRALRLPGRFIWFGAIAASILWPIVAVLRSLRPAPVASAPAVVLLPFTIDVPRMVPAAGGFNVDPLVSAGLVAAWLIVSLVLFSRMARAVGRVRNARSGWRRDVVDGVAVRVSPDLGPAVVGVRRPEIVVPEWTLNLDAPFRALMLRHELEHCDAGDPMLLFAAALAWMCAPWNLAIWYQARRLRLALEMDCDTRVLARHAEHDRYGRLLITIAQRQSNLTAALAPTLSEPISQLEWRIQAMTTSTRRFGRTRAAAFAALAVAAVAAACAVNTPDQVTGPVQLPARRAAMAVNSNSTYFSFQVDKQVDMLPGNAAPHYPDLLRAAHVTGEVIAQFVVDADSTLDMSTFKVIKSTHPLFTDAVRSALATYKFSAAQIQNHPVKQLVQQPFQFSLADVNVGAPARPSAAVTAANRQYSTFSLDKRARLAEGNAAPRYPDMLRSANIEGDVVAEFVVNADGSVDMSTFKVLESTHDLFTMATKTAAANWKYEPALVKGHPVRQLVRAAVSFRLPGSASPPLPAAILVPAHKR